MEKFLGFDKVEIGALSPGGLGVQNAESTWKYSQMLHVWYIYLQNWVIFGVSM